ncbi:MAG: MerR family transcriptional regulator [Defluviitaleaceae bacterium]|nr:MerR family transcriptional regulator [Defluviitaleaceae bacterium]
MFKIGTFSKMVRVSARMLRYYDKFGILSPAEVDKFTGYRLYSAEQIPLLMKIIALRDMGFGVEEIEALLPHYNDAAFMKQALEQKRVQISAAIAEEQTKLEKIREGLNAMVYEVELKSIPPVTVISLRENISSFEAEPAQWEKLWKFISSNHIQCTKTGYSIYHDEAYKDEDVDIEIAVPIDVKIESHGDFIYKNLDSIPQAATIRFAGSYENYYGAMEKLAKWIEQNGYVSDGVIRGHAIVMPAEGIRIEYCLTELQISVCKQ